MSSALATKYPLSRLKRLREFELEDVSAAYRKTIEEANNLQALISACTQKIIGLSADLARKEIETGSVHPELRYNVALCIKAQEIEKGEHEQRLIHVEALRETAYAKLLESKQASKMVERHEERYRSAFFADDIRRMGNEADDLYLARVGATS